MSCCPNERVVISGLAASCGLGVGLPAVWQALLAGQSGVRALEGPSFQGLSSRIGATVPGFDPLKWMDAKDVRRLDPFVQYGLAMAKDAWHDAGLEEEACQAHWEPERAGVIWGTAIGAIGWLERSALDHAQNKKLSPFFVQSTLPNMAGGYVSMALNLQGPNLCQATACAASSHALGLARMMIQQGHADVMVVGGSEQVVSPLTIAGHAAMGALSRRNEDPTRASRPWDRNRDGFVLGDGAAVLILESETHARKRGARIYAEFAGFGLSSDANHPTSPLENGHGAARAMRQALHQARVELDQVDYVNAHGTSTPVGDLAEVAGLKRVFGDHAKKLMISSTKSMTGHLLGAAGALEAVFSVKAIHEQVLPPTINLEEPDAGCDLDFVPLVARQHRVDTVLSNSFGFGGANSSLVFKRYTGFGPLPEVLGGVIG